MHAGGLTGKEFREFGTGVGNPPSKSDIKMMKPVDRYMKLKRKAIDLLLTGDVERYLRALRLMSRLTVR